ncbi:MAG: hypothetical protein KUA35_02910 [Pseudodesulfovibrio sp.]|uniref:Uncharacterized protein n=1 Tax=Pseudodesulfovibrio aespoeensis (strain ATCC 700646 / DSM 10631 / Aspo-2) TaxID=643562 RepID=E6VTL2_PSEA9|nr:MULTISPECIES: hypothetical protein [Pseudodesulfovibrio]MBU4379663.1 hypothetical protein [Pseudomonadota bacterium]ADU62189.1 hypothetical protein Daes_1174 [Pseudodesulfovibrio aespoeensis Aspo-2]MBU4476122.1 hypothetical protein [Pseudomonadota bacterium]MBU4515344.1 hypothetical protein [Pseudomonadota bacterium]MBU4521249.1 hypothetical protein [Pseudomonadota bacterium]
MKLIKKGEIPDRPGPLAGASPEITEDDSRRFFELVSTDLMPWQVEQVITPSQVHARQEALLAVHWHPEFVPMEHIRRRVEAMFPNRQEELLIPTQHNELMSWDGHSGVEVDCYSSGFNRKVQLLLHFADDRVRDAGVLRSMLIHTFKYRSGQLFDFMHTITKPIEPRIQAAARISGADVELVEFVRRGVSKIERLLDEHWADVPRQSVKNKLLRNWFDSLRPELGDVAIDRVQAYLKAVKEIVKQGFDLSFFYRASEVIEEVRGLGGCVVIPHPEQFWPILLRNYDVDGIEVWNPQSQEYTEFLISVVNEQNERRQKSERRVLIFMGDDCHMGEKTKPLDQQDAVKAGREVGLQPAWDDLAVRKRLIVNNISRHSVINEYRARLAG